MLRHTGQLYIGRHGMCRLSHLAADRRAGKHLGPNRKTERGKPEVKMDALAFA